MKWDAHINLVCSKVSRSVAILNKLRHSLPLKVLHTIYNTLTLPYLNYCIGVWGSTEKGNMERLLLLQKRAIRCIFNAGYFDHTQHMFEKLKILKIDQLFKLNTHIFMFKYFRNVLPSPFKNYLKNLRSEHTYNTRSSNFLRTQKFRTEIFRKTIKIMGPKEWNKLPENIKLSKSLKQFKNRVKIHLLSAA